MRPSVKCSAFLLWGCIALAGCSFGKTAPAVRLPDVAGPKIAVLATQTILSGTTTQTPSRPASLLGVYVSHYLAGGWQPAMTAARAGVNAAMMLLGSEQENTNTSFALLQQLGAAMQVDVPDMLNRSSDRAAALDTYVSSLDLLTTRCNTEHDALKQQADTLQTQNRDQQTKVNAIQRTLSDALRQQDYQTASAQQEQIVTAQGDLAKTQSQQRQVDSTIRIFEDLTKASKNRSDAIKANREILIAGLQVVNVPGIGDLGLFKDVNGKKTNGAGSVFGGF